MLHFFKLIRIQNLIMLAFMQLIVRFGFLKLQNIPLALTNWQFVLLVLSTIFIAAGGYVINDIFDQETDNINKPNKVIVGKHISESTSYNIYVALSIIGVSIGFYLSNVIMRPGFATIFIFIASLLYFYATNLKQILLLGNIVIALMLSFSILIICFFDIYPANFYDNIKQMSLLFSILLDYAIMAFIINFIREITKDLEDMNGDYNQGMSTLPIVLGKNRTTKLVFILSFIPILILLYYINMYFMINNLFIASIYTLLLVVGPLIYFTIKIFNAKSSKDFHHLSNVLKWVIFFGIITIAVVTFNINYNA